MVSPCARAEEVIEEPSAGEEGVVYSGGITAFSAARIYTDNQLTYISQVLSKFPTSWHYAVLSKVVEADNSMYPENSYAQYILVVAPDVEVRYYAGRFQPDRISLSGDGMRYFRIEFRGDLDPYYVSSSYLEGWGTLTYDGDLSSVVFSRDRSYDSYSPWTMTLTSASYGDSTESGWYATVWSDVWYFPDLREGGGADYDHATAVILASFVLFAVFRSLWRSIRGRVD